MIKKGKQIFFSEPSVNLWSIYAQKSEKTQLVPLFTITVKRMNKLVENYLEVRHGLASQLKHTDGADRQQVGKGCSQKILAIE